MGWGVGWAVNVHALFSGYNILFLFLCQLGLCQLIYPRTMYLCDSIECFNSQCSIACPAWQSTTNICYSQYTFGCSFESKLQAGRWVWVCSHIFILGSRLKVQLWSETNKQASVAEGRVRTSSFCSEVAFAKYAQIALNVIMTLNPTMGKG